MLFFHAFKALSLAAWYLESPSAAHFGKSLANCTGHSLGCLEASANALFAWQQEKLGFEERERRVRVAGFGAREARGESSVLGRERQKREGEGEDYEEIKLNATKWKYRESTRVDLNGTQFNVLDVPQHQVEVLKRYCATVHPKAVTGAPPEDSVQENVSGAHGDEGIQFTEQSCLCANAWNMPLSTNNITHWISTSIKSLSSAIETLSLPASDIIWKRVEIYFWFLVTVCVFIVLFALAITISLRFGRWLYAWIYRCCSLLRQWKTSPRTKPVKMVTIEQSDVDCLRQQANDSRGRINATNSMTRAFNRVSLTNLVNSESVMLTKGYRYIRVVGEVL